MPALRKIFMMLNYPITITDNFFEDPDFVVSLTEKAKWSNEDNGRWPGERSQPLDEIDPEFFEFLLRRYFLQFFDKQDFDGRFMMNATSLFQRIPAGLDLGWIHADYPKVHTFIIYLTQDADPSSGTGFYIPKSSNVRDDLQYEKASYYRGELDKITARHYAEKHNGQFIQTAYCGNVYNRCVGFDSHLYHGAVDLDNGGRDRLTLITFIDEIVSKKSPLMNSRNRPFIREARR